MLKNSDILPIFEGDLIFVCIIADFDHICIVLDLNFDSMERSQLTKICSVYLYLCLQCLCIASQCAKSTKN